MAAPVILAAGLAIATGVEVFACTATMGPLTFNPPSGPPGTRVLSTAGGLKPYPAKYDMFFGGECMQFNGKLLKTITTNASGGWTNVPLNIPKSATLGLHALCGIELYPVKGQTATDHASWTVT